MTKERYHEDCGSKNFRPFGGGNSKNTVTVSLYYQAPQYFFTVLTVAYNRWYCPTPLCRITLSRLLILTSVTFVIENELVKWDVEAWDETETKTLLDFIETEMFLRPRPHACKNRSHSITSCSLEMKKRTKIQTWEHVWYIFNSTAQG